MSYYESLRVDDGDYCGAKQAYYDRLDEENEQLKKENDGLKERVEDLLHDDKLLKDENRELRRIIKQYYEVVEHEWHAENGAVINDAI